MLFDEFPLILIYYKFRGQLQPVRNICCYLEIPFIEIQLDNYEEQKKHISPVIMQTLCKMKIEKSQVPALVAKKLVVYGHIPMMTYICKTYNGEHLFGSNIRVKARVYELL